MLNRLLLVSKRKVLQKIESSPQSEHNFSETKTKIFYSSDKIIEKFIGLSNDLKEKGSDEL